MLFLLLELSGSFFGMAPSSYSVLMAIALGCFDVVGIVFLGCFDDGLLLLWARDVVYR